MKNLFETSMVNALQNLYYWMEKVNKSILTGENCFLEANYALQAAHRIDFYKELYKEQYEKCDWFELIKIARKRADEAIKND